MGGVWDWGICDKTEGDLQIDAYAVLAYGICVTVRYPGLGTGVTDGHSVGAGASFPVLEVDGKVRKAGLSKPGASTGKREALGARNVCSLDLRLGAV